MELRTPGDSIIVLSKSGPAGNSVAAIPGAFTEVKFGAHDSTFLMFYSACGNPGCSCADVVVTFSEKRSHRTPGHSRTEFGVELNVKTWKAGLSFAKKPAALIRLTFCASGPDTSQA